jgi:thioredoxin-related protein
LTFLLEISLQDLTEVHRRSKNTFLLSDDQEAALANNQELFLVFYQNFCDFSAEAKASRFRFTLQETISILDHKSDTRLAKGSFFDWRQTVHRIDGCPFSLD